MRNSLALLVVVAGVAAGQDAPRPVPPQIVTSGQGEVRLAPDKATISVGVQTRAATAADAAAQNSRKQRAVIDAIRARGVDATQIGTSGFAVIPETRYDKDQTPRTVSYLVSNVVTVELRRVDQVGAVIDAALAAGANQINSLDFGLSSADSARRVALSTAVSRARADAEAMARAAGGSLGPLIELTAADLYVPPPRPVAMVMRAEAAQDTSVPVEAGQETVRASVTARWQFIQGGQPK